MTARRRIFQGLLASIYGRGVLIAGQVLLVPILITRWTLTGFGEWVAISAIASYLSYTNIGMPGALRAHMAMAFSRDGHVAMKEAFHSALALITTVAGAIGLIYIVALQFLPMGEVLKLHWLAPREAIFVATILGLQLVIYAISSVFMAALSSIGQYPKATLLDAHRQTFEFLAMLVVVGVLRQPPWVAVLIYLISWSGLTLALAFSVWRAAPWLYAGPPSLRLDVLKELAAPMLGVLGMTFGYVGMSVQAPRIILAATVGPKATAIYAVASMMMRIVRIPIDIPAHSATVEISLTAGQGDWAAARGLLSNTTRVCLWLALIAAPFVITLGPWASYFWSNHRTQAPMSVLALMSVSTTLFALSLPCQEGLMAIGQLNRATKWLLWYAAPFIGLCWILSRQFGLNGAAGAVITLDLVYALSGMSAATRYFHYPRAGVWKPLKKPPLDLLLTELKRLRILGRPTRAAS